jgi:hypothetical protein
MISTRLTKKINFRQVDISSRRRSGQVRFGRRETAREAVRSPQTFAREVLEFVLRLMSVALLQSASPVWRQMSRCMIQNEFFDGFSETFFFR